MRDRTCAQYDRSYVLNVLQNVTHLIYKKVFECGIEHAHNMMEGMY
jgi:phosphoribosyl-ATP pyrophosphohydrolase